MSNATLHLADRYTDWLCGSRVCETPPLQPARNVPALELQARWFAGEFGREFVTTAGQPVAILEFGAWNGEAGPHFAGALVAFQGERPVRGGIELNEQAADWETHAGSPDYEGTVLHVFAGGGVGGSRTPGARTTTAGGREVPQIRLNATPFEFTPAAPPPGATCCAPLAPLAENRVEALLEAAAQYRLCRKAARLRRLAGQSNPEEALYQMLAETLGYKNNKLPFALLSQRFPLSRTRGQADAIEPLLFAGSGFLTAADLGAMPGDTAADTRGYLRDLWNRWWPRRSEMERLILPPQVWTLKGLRPVNHPQRRVAALAEIVRNWPVIQSLAPACDVVAIRGFFAQMRHEYWDFHYTLTSRRARRPMALVGGTRTTEILANVFFPAAIVAAPRCWEAYRRLPAPDASQKVELASRRLLGENPARDRLLKRTVFQQGLLQLYEDHCLECQGDCARCSLPERLEHWRR